MLMIALGLGGVRAQEDASRPEFYTTKVKPILDENCARCHGGMNHRGGLNISTREGMLKGGRDGAVLVPGDPDKSLLVRLIRHEGPADDPMPMPPNRPKLSDADIAVVAQWVKAGAVMPVDVPKP
jgi:mono/diheme cytochrome c family protein